MLNDEEFLDPNLARNHTNPHSLSRLPGGGNLEHQLTAQSMGNWAPAAGKISSASSPAGAKAKSTHKARDDLAQQLEVQNRKKAASKAAKQTKGKRLRQTDLFMMSVKMQGPVPAHGYGFGEKKEQRLAPNSGHTAPSKLKNPYINDN